MILSDTIGYSSGGGVTVIPIALPLLPLPLSECLTLSEQRRALGRRRMDHSVSGGAEEFKVGGGEGENRKQKTQGGPGAQGLIHDRVDVRKVPTECPETSGNEPQRLLTPPTLCLHIHWITSNPSGCPLRCQVQSPDRWCRSHNVG